MSAPTPRTDAASRLVRATENGVLVHADLARTLERELNAERDKAERYRLITLRQDAELAAERARLDWLLSRMGGNVLPANKCVAWTVNVYHYGNRFPSRAAIDAAMKEETK